MEILNKTCAPGTLSKFKLVVMNKEGPAKKVKITSSSNNINDFENVIDKSVIIKEEIDVDESTVEAEEIPVVNEQREETPPKKLTKPFKCGVCFKTYVHSSSYKRHIATHVKRFHCDLCEKSFDKQEFLNKHRKEHITPQTYQCSECPNTSFAKLDDYAEHMKTHGCERPYECEICHRTFVRKSHHERHFKIHSSNMPLFKCEICTKTYSQESSLKQHVSKHSAYYEYECQICQQKFIRLIDHVAHMKSHEEKRSSNGPEWSKEATCTLIKLFHKRPELWDSSRESYHDGQLKHDAWVYIARVMDLSVKEVEKKVRCLIWRFKTERKKEKLKREKEDEEKPRWFAYDLLTFLEDRNKIRDENTLEQTTSCDESYDHDEEETNYSESNIKTILVDSSSPDEMPVVACYENENEDEIPQVRSSERTDNEKISDLNTIIRGLQNKIVPRDEYDIFGESIACNLRKLKTSYAKSTVKYHINNILYQAELGHYDQPPCTPRNSSVRSLRQASESVGASTEDLDTMLNDL